MGAPSDWYLCPPWMHPLWLLDCRLGTCLTHPTPNPRKCCEEVHGGDLGTFIIPGPLVGELTH